jgi:hypothetical protein
MNKKELYNPEWILDKTIKKWVLVNEGMVGYVYPQITRDYKWEVFRSTDSVPFVEGIGRDRIAAFAAVEKVIGYKYFVEPEYTMSAGCRCGSCEDPTGKWRVWDRYDTVELLFDCESEAVAWVVAQEKDK